MLDYSGVDLFKYIDELADEGLRDSSAGEVAHFGHVLLELLVIDVEGILLVDEGLYVLCVLAYDDRV